MFVVFVTTKMMLVAAHASDSNEGHFVDCPAGMKRTDCIVRLYALIRRRK